MTLFKFFFKEFSEVRSFCPISNQQQYASVVCHSFQFQSHGSLLFIMWKFLWNVLPPILILYRISLLWVWSAPPNCPNWLSLRGKGGLLVLHLGGNNELLPKSSKRGLKTTRRVQSAYPTFFRPLSAGVTMSNTNRVTVNCLLCFVPINTHSSCQYSCSSIADVYFTNLQCERRGLPDLKTGT